jgi:hypothetical protein
MGSGFEMARLVFSISRNWLLLALSVAASCFIGLTGQSDASQPERSGLFESSQDFVKAFNTKDYKKISELLSNDLRKAYDYRRIAAEILKCRQEFFETIIRTSLPTSGGKYWGFFAVYGQKKNTSMLMEIDRNGKIIAFMMGDNLIEGKYKCGFLK